jgi:hypothetical protein
MVVSINKTNRLLFLVVAVATVSFSYDGVSAFVLPLTKIGSLASSSLYMSSTPTTKTTMQVEVSPKTKTTSDSLAIPTTTGTGMNPTIFTINKILIDTVYQLICILYPVTGTSRDFARFYVLETVARVPYFAYLSVLHLRETFGERYPTMSDKMRTHYAQADNELHHLLIMEDLGGNSRILDRWIAQSAAFVYYWYVVALFARYEPAAYHLSELIEDHAYNTYNKVSQ